MRVGKASMTVCRLRAYEARLGPAAHERELGVCSFDERCISHCRWAQKLFDPRLLHCHADDGKGAMVRQG